MLQFFAGWLARVGMNAELAVVGGRVVGMVFVLVLAAIANFAAKRPILSAMKAVAARTRTNWDDALIRHRFLDRLAHVAPAAVVYLMTPVALEGVPRLTAFVTGAALVYMILIGALAVDALLNALLEVYSSLEIAREMHIKGAVQVGKIALYFFAGVMVVSTVLNKSPVFIFSGMGALTAVIMLVFKDAILGFVAGVQLTTNRMVAIGDWVEMPKYEADGDVIEVALTTVKVQNWDKTITTIPTYSLITESFRNWRGMKESGGRRIKRAITIDMNTIKLCDEEMLKRFAQIQYIGAYIAQKRQDVAEYNAARGVDDSSRVNGRRLTNIGTFRAYVVAYLKNHPMINLDMTFLVRQLAPCEHGLPLEIYVFCKDQVWANYEGIQADIFDHILAVVPEFDLRVYQSPAGTDFQRLVTG